MRDSFVYLLFYFLLAFFFVYCFSLFELVGLQVFAMALCSDFTSHLTDVSSGTL